MKLNYYNDTDSLYIDLSEKESVETIEIALGINLDLDEAGEAVGIDIDNASKKLNMKELTISQLPSKVVVETAL
jgi:uncharacterized protein YuzE